MSIDIFSLVARYLSHYDYNSTTKRALTELLDELRDGSKSDYLGTLYRTDFSVTGRAPFPVDMLRYCNAWPTDERDAAQIERSLDQDTSPTITVRLTKYHRDATPQLADDRWESKFRWKIVRGGSDETRINTMSI